MNWNRNLSTINIRTILNCNYTTLVANTSHKIILYFFLYCHNLNIINIYVLDMFKTNQRKETMKIITQAEAIKIITLHGNIDEFFYFIKELGNKKEYKLKDVKSWLGY